MNDIEAPALVFETHYSEHTPVPTFPPNGPPPNADFQSAIGMKWRADPIRMLTNPIGLFSSSRQAATDRNHRFLEPPVNEPRDDERAHRDRNDHNRLRPGL